MLRISLSMIAAVLFVACASRREYDRLRNAFDSDPFSRFYHTEMTAKEIAPPAALIAQDDVEKQINAYISKWQAKGQVADSSVQILDLGKLKPVSVKDLEKRVELQALLALAWQRNPGLKAARNRLRASLERYPQTVYLDNILKQYNAFTRQLNTRIGPQKQKTMTAMQFPSPDTLALKGQIVSQEVAEAQQAYEIVLRDLVASIKRMFYSHAYLVRAIQINHQSQALLKQSLVVTRSKYSTDQGTYAHVLMTQVELAKLSDKIITLEQERRTLVGQINALLDRNQDAKLGPPAAEPLSALKLELPQLYKATVNHRQEVRKLRFTIERIELMSKLASRMANPDPTMGASYLESRAAIKPKFKTTARLSERNHAFFGQQDAYAREIRLRTTAIRQQLAELENQTKAQAKKLFYRLDAANRSLKLYRRTLLPQALQGERAAQTGYKNGKTSFGDYLDAQRTLLEFQLAEAKAIRDHSVALVELDRLTGYALPKVSMSELKEITP